MLHGTYVGFVAELQGETALLREHPEHSDLVLAQFDKRDLEQNGVRLGFNWHEFYRWNFEIDPPEEIAP